LHFKNLYISKEILPEMSPSCPQNILKMCKFR
jgi:hypothetical protein